jgi:hypothetical protein
MQAALDTKLDETFVYSNLLSYIQGWYSLTGIEDYTSVDCRKFATNLGDSRDLRR